MRVQNEIYLNSLKFDKPQCESAREEELVLKVRAGWKVTNTVPHLATKVRPSNT